MHGTFETPTFVPNYSLIKWSRSISYNIACSPSEKFSAAFASVLWVAKYPERLQADSED